MERLLPFIEGYPQTLFHVDAYVPSGMNGNVNIVPPAIDPLTPKNMALSIEDATFVCDQFGIDTSRPVICQVSRFDPWKDPLGVIEAYRLAREEVPNLQLALVGSMALDDPAHGKALGLRGKEHVRAHFLTPRYLRDYLKIFHEVL